MVTPGTIEEARQSALRAVGSVYSDNEGNAHVAVAAAMGALDVFLANLGMRSDGSDDLVSRSQAAQTVARLAVRTRSMKKPAGDPLEGGIVDGLLENQAKAFDEAAAAIRAMPCADDLIAAKR